MDTPFGALITPNITPDDETGIGKWTADDLYRAMHDGVNKAGQDLYPVMPYTFFTKVTRADVDDIYAYLRTVKPVANRVDVNQLRFPFDIRLTQMAWRELYFTEGTFVPEPRPRARSGIAAPIWSKVSGIAAPAIRRARSWAASSAASS